MLPPYVMVLYTCTNASFTLPTAHAGALELPLYYEVASHHGFPSGNYSFSTDNDISYDYNNGILDYYTSVFSHLGRRARSLLHPRRICLGRGSTKAPSSIEPGTAGS